jgi:hypothetical protein
MNNEMEKLHAAVRRYCLEQYSYWTKKYGELVSEGKDRFGNQYANEALYTFPRYNVLNAILVEVERHRPVDFSSIDDAKRVLKSVALNAQSIFTQPPNGNLEQTAMNEEREALAKFISELSNNDLLLVEPLFYRRVLTAEEGATIWDKLETDWGVSEGYWYPLANRKRQDIEAFQDKYFEKEVGTEPLRKLLRTHGIETLWEMREDGVNYELELSVFEPYYNGSEGYWCDATFQWIVYASHESSVTIGGWLLSEINDVWSNWRQRVWTSPFFE